MLTPHLPHMALVGQQFTMVSGISARFVSRGTDCPGSRPFFQGGLYRKDLEERDSNPFYQRAGLLRDH